MQALTPFQTQLLPVIRQLVLPYSWLPTSYVMAHVRIESGWNPNAISSDGLGSVGLMQVLPSTAKDRGFAGKNQADPTISLQTGIAQLVWIRTYLMNKWGFHSTIAYSPICRAYNEGVGNVIAGHDDTRYWLKWSCAQQSYAFVDNMAT